MITNLENTNETVHKFDHKIIYQNHLPQNNFFKKITHFTETLYFLILIFMLSEVSAYIHLMW